MYKYGFINYFEGSMKITDHELIEVGPWFNLYITFHFEDVEILPEGLNEPSALVVFDKDGELQDIIAHDEGVDCEYKFTDKEKEQLIHYVKGQGIKEMIVKE